MLDSLIAPVGTALDRVEAELNWIRKQLKRLREAERHMKTNLDAIAEQCEVKTISGLELNVVHVQSMLDTARQRLSKTGELPVLKRLTGHSHELQKSVEKLVKRVHNLGLDVRNSSAGIFWVDLENELEDELEEDPGIGSSVFSRVKTIAAGVATNPTMDSNHISSPSISESCYTEETDTTASFPLTESPLARELFSRQIDWTIPRSPLTIDDLERFKH